LVEDLDTVDRILGRREQKAGNGVLLLVLHISGLFPLAPRTGCPLWKKYTSGHSLDSIVDRPVLVVDTLDRSVTDVLGPQCCSVNLPLPDI